MAARGTGLAKIRLAAVIGYADDAPELLPRECNVEETFSFGPSYDDLVILESFWHSVLTTWSDAENERRLLIVCHEQLP